MNKIKYVIYLILRASYPFAYVGVVGLIALHILGYVIYRDRYCVCERDAKLIAVKSDLNNFKEDIMRYYRKYKQLPEKLSDLKILVSELDVSEEVKKILLGNMPIYDPWDNPYLYIKKGDEYILVCAGEDKMFFTCDDDVIIHKVKR